MFNGVVVGHGAAGFGVSGLAGAVAATDGEFASLGQTPGKVFLIDCAILGGTIKERSANKAYAVLGPQEANAVF